MSSRIADNLARIRQQMAEACRTAGREAASVRLVAVTKYVGDDEIRALLAAGCYDLGESRPQSLWERAATHTEPNVRWHFVGHLQRNKVRRTLPHISLLHSADSMRLLAELDVEAAAIGRTLGVLLEVNISRDANKSGFAPDDVEPELPAIASLKNIRVCGLMGMAALEGDRAVALQNFTALRELRDRLQAVAPSAIQLPELSMGMSGDFEEAIAAGATIVRIGSALFE